MASARPMILHGWPLSYYSGKLRAYLRYKGIAFVERKPSLWSMRRLHRAVGAQVMPVLQLPDGQYRQDSSAIIDELEGQFSDWPITPPGPRQQLVSLLIDAWGSEFWLPSAMHYRWNFAENFDTLFAPEAGAALLPGAPRWLQHKAAEKAAGLLRAFLPGLGVTPAQHATIEGWTEAMLDVLDAHFAKHPYLLGSRPCHGDFGLIGPLFAHLGRDPYPRRVLMQPRRHLYAWIQRMDQPAGPGGGEFLPKDELPGSLDAVLESVFSEFLPFLQATREQLAALPAPARGRGYPRQIGDTSIALGGHAYVRNTTPFSLWMLQRMLDQRSAMSPAQRSLADAWLNRHGALAAVDALSAAPRLRRLGLRVIPE